MTKRLSIATGRLWLSDEDPTDSETSVERGNFFLNTGSGVLFFCVDPTIGSQVWKTVNFLTNP